MIGMAIGLGPNYLEFYVFRSLLIEFPFSRPGRVWTDFPSRKENPWQNFP
jgi:hypothetical protein